MGPELILSVKDVTLVTGTVKLVRTQLITVYYVNQKITSSYQALHVLMNVLLQVNLLIPLLRHVMLVMGTV